MLNAVFARSDKVTAECYTDLHRTFGVRCCFENYEIFSKRHHWGYIYRKSKPRLVVHFVRPCHGVKLFYSKILILGKNIYFEVTVSIFNVNNSQGGDMKKFIVCFYDVGLIQGFTSGVKQYYIFILVLKKRSAAEIVQRMLGQCAKGIL